MALGKKLKEKLPFFIKLQAGKLIVGILRPVLRLSGKFLRFAAQNGLNLERELPDSFVNLAQNLQTRENVQPFSLTDFLMLTEPETDVAETVKASIIIPVFNKAEYTFQCLRSLFRAVDLTKNEIVVVDNASSDETARMLAHFKNRVRIIRNEENKGFVEGCNQGANAAKGEFLIFLNNDTIVQPLWLESLIETIESDATIGAVGSLVIAANGRIQEAGGIVWRDGSAHHYGRDEHAEDSRFNFAREVDYCSGASLAIRKDLFERLGAFDMRFAPAYYEDTDLCMSVRACGKKVVFQPASRLVHYEGVTAGTNTSSGIKRFQEINRRKFVEKWRGVLEKEHLAPDVKNIFAASNRRRGRQIAVFYDRAPQLDKNSTDARLFAVLRLLSQFANIVFVPIHESGENQVYKRELGKIGIETVWTVDFEKRLRQEKFDAVILGYPEVANTMLSAVKRILPGAKIIYDTVDVHFVRLGREFQITKNAKFAEEAERLKKIETHLAREADEVWCVTEIDKKFLQAVAPEAKIEIVPNIYAPQTRGKTFAERRDLLFVGDFKQRPNIDAIVYFLDEIFPLVLEKLPDVRLRIVGDATPTEVFARNAENISVEGFVSNATPIFSDTRVFVAPLRFGAGISGEIGQALAFGLPTVTTEIGAEGMNLIDGQEILLANGAREFAEAIARVYQSEELWKRLAENGYRFIEQNFSPVAVEHKILTAFETVFDGERKLHR